MNQATKDDLKDILDFLNQVIPFSSLDDDAQFRLAKNLSIEYIPERAKQSIAIDECVYLVRTGAFEIIGEHNQLVDRLAEGECFGISTLLYDNPENLRVVAIEDSLVYILPKDAFLQLLEQHSNLKTFFEKLVNYRTTRMMGSSESNKLPVQHTQPIESLLQNRLVYCSVDNSIREAAEIMRENKVSCLLLLQEDQLKGIVTDRDLRNRVVADAFDVNLPVSRIATLNPVTIAADAALLEAQLLMSNIGVHHLPVLKSQQPIGVVTASDIVRAHSVSLIHFVDRIFREKTPADVAALQAKVPELLDYWIQADVSPQEIGESFAVIGDGFVRKAVQFALQKHGDAPMQFAWLTFGSQARKEQSFASDQDNGLILEREPSEDEAQYFAALSQSICQLLHEFGYVLCPGDIMASNPEWRKTKASWIKAFRRWIDQPEPEALLNASIFFDMRVVYGPTEWLDEMHAALKPALANADLFFMHMTRNALRSKPPLGFFRSFLVNEKGDHENELNLKHRGIALINDLARIVALAEGNLTPFTHDRLLNTGNSRLQAPIRRSLWEAWLLLNQMKLETQAQQLKDGEPTSNYLNPDDLTPLKRAHLKSAFKTIERAQKALSQHYLRAAGG